MAEGNSASQSDNDAEEELAKEPIISLRKNSEKRFDLRIIVIGHLAAGKTAVIDRILGKPVAVDTRNSTNGIVITRRGGIQIDDGKWLQSWKPSDIDDISQRLKDAISTKRTVPGKVYIKKSMLESYTQDIRKIMQIIKKRHKKGTICRLLFFDFAGQSVFNSCHQMFMSHRAIYLLVIDISRALDSEVEDDDVFCVGANRRMSVEELTIFLLSSIHMYRGQNPHEFPKVLLVGTHKDKVDQAQAKKKIEKLKESFRGTPLQQHVVGDVIVDNSLQKDSGIEDLKTKIFTAAKRESFWGTITPNKWMPLEMRIIETKDNGTRILTLRDIKEFNRKSYAPLHSTEEIREFLTFHNHLGYMMYYGGLDDDDIVILDPQWLIDSLKQIITHEQFYIRVKGFTDVWREFTQSAKLHKKLIKAVWSQNEDKSFIEHKDKIIEILEITDIISCPKVYDEHGKMVEQAFFFVPSMLRPSQEGVSYVDGLEQLCLGRSSTLCFVFKDNFMPPAIFPRIQAACTREYRMKRIQGKPLLFYKLAVFELNRSYYLLLEHIEYTIRITVLNEDKSYISSNVCLSILSFIEESLRDVAKLYCSSGKEKDLPFYKAIHCKVAESKLDALHPWDELSEKTTVLCTGHKRENWHRFHTSTLMDVWSPDRNGTPNPDIYRRKTGTQCSVIYSRKTRGLERNRNMKLGTVELGRLSRTFTVENLRTLAFKKLDPEEIDRMELENKDCAADFKFALLFQMDNYEKGFTIISLHQDLKESDIGIDINTLDAALEDADASDTFEGIPASFLQNTLSDQSIDQISQRTGKEYKQLGIELGVHPKVIERIVSENWKIVNRTRAILKENADVTYINIGQAIVNVGMDRSLITSCHELCQ